LKLRSVRSNVIMLVAIVVISVGFSVLISILTSKDNFDTVSQRITPSLFGTAFFCRLLFGVVGVQIISQEYRFNTIRVTFVNEPRRLRVLGAKAIVLCIATVVVAAVTLAAAVGASTVIMSHRGLPIQFSAPGVGANLVGTVVLCLLHALVGLGVGAIVRQPVGGTIFMTVWPLVVENILAGALPKVGKWLPFFEGTQLVSFDSDRRQHVFSRVGGGVYLGLFAVLVLVVGSYLVHRRDA